MAKNVLTHHLSIPLDGAAAAGIDISTAEGNLTIDALRGGPELARGALEYLETQGPPTCTLNVDGERAELTLKSCGSGRPWIRLPWAACNAATEWQIQLHPAVALDITAHSGGGNITLNLAGLTIARLAADTGGGNMQVILPDTPGCLTVMAKTGAGNLFVELPPASAATIHATSGLGRVTVDDRFLRVDRNTFQSTDFAEAANTVEIIVSSGAGNVLVAERGSPGEAAAFLAEARRGNRPAPSEPQQPF